MVQAYQCPKLGSLNLSRHFRLANRIKRYKIQGQADLREKRIALQTLKVQAYTGKNLQVNTSILILHQAKVQKDEALRTDSSMQDLIYCKAKIIANKASQDCKNTAVLNGKYKTSKPEIFTTNSQKSSWQNQYRPNLPQSSIPDVPISFYISIQINFSQLNYFIYKQFYMALSIKVKPLILIGCEGSGRSALTFHLIRKFPHKFQRVISHTTRKPRQAEKDKEHYYFVDDKYVTNNLQKFVTLTKSENSHYYGLVGEEIVRVVGQNKIPIFKMTLQAYKNNISKDNTIQIKEQAKAGLSPIQKVASLFKNPIHQYLTRNKSIQCNCLYITMPDIKELQRRLKCSPVQEKQQQYRIEKAKKEHAEFSKYFEQEDVIKASEDMEKTVKQLQSRLFQLY